MTRQLGEAEGYALLAKYGIRVPNHAVAASREEAGARAEAIGYPVVLKVVSPDIVHKSDAGGVKTGVKDRSEAEEAYDAILAAIAAARPGAAVRGVIVEEELPPGREFIIGGTTDPAFGRVIAVGAGGVLVELLDDTAFSLVPVSEERIRESIRGLKAHALIRGYRGARPLDEDALVQAVQAAARLFAEEDEVGEFDINPLILYEKGACAVDARFITGRTPQIMKEARPPFAFPAPRSIAVVGASSDPKKIGYAIMRNLLHFSGQVFPVNPKHARVLGVPAYASVREIPADVDMAVIAVPAPLVAGIVDECGERGIGLVVIVSAGFRESGDEGAVREKEVIRAAQAHDIRVLGPNCLGIMLPHLGINATFDSISPKAGHLGFLSQSGAVITMVADWSVQAGVGFSAVVSVGNQADLDFSDLLAAIADDPQTRAVILYIEEIRDGRRFLGVAGSVTGRLPVIAVKSGASAKGKAAASSHTGSLAGSYAVYAAAFREAGVILAGSLEEAFQIGELLASEGYPGGDRCFVISGAGGFAVLASDYAEKYGVSLPPLPDVIRRELDALLPPIWNRANPMDIIGDGGAERYAKVFDIMIEHQEAWDIAVVVTVPSAVLNPVEMAHEIVRFSKKTGKMVVCSLLGGETMGAAVRILKDNCLPNFPEIEDAFRAIGSALAVQKQGAEMGPACDREEGER
ncbi:MAG: acetyltransferase [Methanofollis sp.]|nr:acetyltransferase [Methanofollis sp.]